MKNQTEALEHASVRQYCKVVRMPAIGANFISLAEQAVKENQTHIRYLEALLQVESEERDRHAIANRIRDAQLPRMKTLEEFDFAQAPRIPAAARLTPSASPAAIVDAVRALVEVARPRRARGRSQRFHLRVPATHVVEWATWGCVDEATER